MAYLNVQIISHEKVDDMKTENVDFNAPDLKAAETEYHKMIDEAIVDPVLSKIRCEMEKYHQAVLRDIQESGATLSTNLRDAKTDIINGISSSLDEEVDLLRIALLKNTDAQQKYSRQGSQMIIFIYIILIVLIIDIALRIVL